MNKLNKSIKFIEKKNTGDIIIDRVKKYLDNPKFVQAITTFINTFDKKEKDVDCINKITEIVCIEFGMTRNEVVNVKKNYIQRGLLYYILNEKKNYSITQLCNIFGKDKGFISRNVSLTKIMCEKNNKLYTSPLNDIEKRMKLEGL